VNESEHFHPVTVKVLPTNFTFEHDLDWVKMKWQVKHRGQK